MILGWGGLRGDRGRSRTLHDHPSGTGVGAAGAVAARDAVEHRTDLGGRAAVEVFEVEVADDLVGVVGGPALEAGSRQAGGDVRALEVQLGGRGEHTHRAHHREADGDQGDDDGQPGGDTGQIDRQSAASRHNQVAEHTLGEVDRSRRSAQGGGHDEPEDVEHPRHEAREDVRAAGGTIGVGREGVQQQPDDEEDGRDADGDEHERRS